MPEIEIAPGRTTHYDIVGRDGAPVVQLISGGGMHRRSWKPTVAALAGEFRVVTFDYRSAGQLTAFEAHDVRDELHAIQAPTLVVEGELDLGLLVLGAEMIAQRVPNARLMYPGVGHFPMAERAEQFHADIVAFMGDGLQPPPIRVGR